MVFFLYLHVVYEKSKRLCLFVLIQDREKNWSLPIYTVQLKVVVGNIWGRRHDISMGIGHGAENYLRVASKLIDD